MPIKLPRIRLRPGMNGLGGTAFHGPAVDRLSDLGGIRQNPGNLRARVYVPEGLAGPAPLVVVLHGCTQTAAAYDHGSGWSALADRLGFVLLYPEQQRANNNMQCFNWFSPAHTARGRGEAASIRSMIESVQATHAIDPSRIFVTGLSAGGAMASAMLATYPDVFAAGAILAGVPYACAGDVTEAFQCMGGRVHSDAGELGRRVRNASPHKGPWPRVQIWQGSADHTVVPANAEAIARQWADVHGLGETPDREDQVEGYPRRVWLDAAGKAVIEQYLITGMAHGVPLALGAEDALGAAGPHMLDVGLDSTKHIAAFFGIAAEARVTAQATRSTRAAAPAKARPRPAQPDVHAPAENGPQQIIEKALKAAGLMR